MLAYAKPAYTAYTASLPASHIHLLPLLLSVYFSAYQHICLSTYLPNCLLGKPTYMLSYLPNYLASRITTSRYQNSGSKSHLWSHLFPTLPASVIESELDYLGSGFNILLCQKQKTFVHDQIDSHGVHTIYKTSWGWAGPSSSWLTFEFKMVLRVFSEGYRRYLALCLTSSVSQSVS